MIRFEAARLHFLSDVSVPAPYLEKGRKGPENEWDGSCLKPLFQSEAKCEAIDMKMIFHSHANKLISREMLCT